MLTTNPIYAYSRGRAQNSVYNGYVAPVSGDFLYPIHFGGAENTIGASRIISRDYRHVLSPRSLAGLGNLSKKVYNMNNSISIYNFNQNQVRTTQIDNEPYFCLVDACRALGLSNSRQAVRDVYKIYTPTTSGDQEISFINEPNLYRLIFRSNKPQAQAFADWVYSEVLPQIRKTGAYGVPTETAPAPLDTKTLGGVVKRCAAAAVRDELETLPELVKAQVEQTVYEVLSKVFYPGITEHPSGMPFGNWAVAAVQAIGAMTSEYDNLKQKQQAVINLLQDK